MDDGTDRHVNCSGHGSVEQGSTPCVVLGALVGASVVLTEAMLGLVEAVVEAVVDVVSTAIGTHVNG